MNGYFITITQIYLKVNFIPALQTPFLDFVARCGIIIVLPFLHKGDNRVRYPKQKYLEQEIAALLAGGDPDEDAGGHEGLTPLRLPEAVEFEAVLAGVSESSLLDRIAREAAGGESRESGTHRLLCFGGTLLDPPDWLDNPLAEAEEEDEEE